MKPVFPDFDKPVTRKVGAFWILAQLPFILSACNGEEPPGSKHSLVDKYQINAQTTEVAIKSEGENLFQTSLRYLFIPLRPANRLSSALPW